MFEIGPLSIFAKILASENISVSIETVETAMFDLKHRRLIIPDWEFNDENFTKMLVAHEVAHAIYTPLQQWAEHIKKKTAAEGRQAKHFLNVVEDCRIDKLIQLRYPGLVSTYMHSANYLVKEDFFKIGSESIKSFAFIDRINLYFKTKFGADGYDVPFNSDEMVFVKRIQEVEDFSEVVKIADELQELYNEEARTKTFEDLENFNDDPTGERKEAEDNNSEKDFSGRVSVDENDEGKEQEEDAVVVKVDAPSLGCTQENLLRNLTQKNLLNVAKSYKTVGGTQKISIIKSSDIIKRHWWNVNSRERGGYDKARKTGTNPETVRQIWRNYITTFTSSFERKKNARNFMKTKVESTGILDVNKLYEHKFNDDIFLSNIVEGHNKNHGFVFLIDCSGSMNNIFEHVATQLFVMTEICKKLQIPCRAYGFSDYYKPKMPVANFSGTAISLLEFYSEKNSRQDNLRAFKEIYDGNLSLGGTPLGDSLYAMRTIIEEFKRETHVDVVNFLSLTDGGDGTGRPFDYLSDEKTGALIKAGFSTRLTMDNTSAMYRLIRKATGAKVVHIDITDNPSDGTGDFKLHKYCVIKEYGGANYTFFVSPSALEPKNKKLIELFADALK